MIDEIIAFFLNVKAGIVMVAGNPLLAWFASMRGWMDASVLEMSAVASFVLVLVMIVSHMCDTIRKNREHRSVMRERELKIELLEKELRGE